MKSLIGITSFGPGNLPFTKLAVHALRETIKGDCRRDNNMDGNCDRHPNGCPQVHIGVIIGMPGDIETMEWCKEQRFADSRFHWLDHKTNRGFAASINDFYDRAFLPPRGDFDNLIIMGSDVIPYPGAVDALIECADTTDYEWICSSQYDTKSLCRDYVEARQFFTGDRYLYSDFSARPWDLHLPSVLALKPSIVGNSMCDVRNLCLFKRSVFDKIGYADVNFWPSAYFEDNCYCRRAVLAGVKGCALPHSAYFHFWSRVMHQEASRKATHDRYFQANERYYHAKWGGPVGGEKFTVPFNGKALEIAPGVIAPSGIKIGSRLHEDAMIEMWAKMA